MRTLTALLADAFASGLESAGVIPTMKHFPGIGFATQNTDVGRGQDQGLDATAWLLACSPTRRRSATTSR